MARDKSAAFIPVRLTSSRLPEKHLKTIGPKSIISWVIHRLKCAKEVDEIVICSPNEPETEKLRPVARDEGASLFVYEGGVDDVVGRLSRATELYEADICVLASGDCPLLHPATIDSMVRLLRDDPTAGHVSFAVVLDKMPIHEGIVISRRWVWQRAERLSDTTALREHHFPVFLRGVYPEKFADVKTLSFKDDELFYSLRHRISVDTPHDLVFMNALYDEIDKSSQDFTLVEAIKLMHGNHALKTINNRVYQKGFGELSYRVLFIYDKDGISDIGSCLDLADALVHYHGIGVEFLVGNDSPTVNDRGYKTIMGTRGDILKLSMKHSASIYCMKDYFNIEIPLTGGCKVRENQLLHIGRNTEDAAAEIAKLIMK